MFNSFKKNKAQRTKRGGSNISNRVFNVITTWGSFTYFLKFSFKVNWSGFTLNFFFYLRLGYSWRGLQRDKWSRHEICEKNVMSFYISTWWSEQKFQFCILQLCEAYELCCAAICAYITSISVDVVAESLYFASFYSDIQQLITESLLFKCKVNELIAYVDDVGVVKNFHSVFKLSILSINNFISNQSSAIIDQSIF